MSALMRFAEVLSEKNAPIRNGVRTIPVWSGQCFCGEESWFQTSFAHFYDPREVVRHLACSRCGATFLFRSEFKCVDGDGAQVFRFVQQDHEMGATRTRAEEDPVTDGRYR